MVPFPVVIALSRESNGSRTNSFTPDKQVTRKIIAQYNSDPHSAVNEIQE